MCVFQGIPTAHTVADVPHEFIAFSSLLFLCMKRILLLLLMAASCQVRAQFLTNLNNFRTFNAGYGALTGTSVIHPPMVFGNVDSVCNYLGQLYGLIGASGDLQAVTALGNYTTHGMFISNSGTYSSPGSGVKITPSGGMLMYVSGVFTGGLSSTDGIGGNSGSFISKDPGSIYQSRLSSGGLTDYRYQLMPDEGDGMGIKSTVVLHQTKYQIIVGDLTVDGADLAQELVGLFKSGVEIGAIDNVGGAGTGRLTLGNLPHGGGTQLYGDTSNSVHVSYVPPVNGTLASRSDTVGGAGMSNILTSTSGVTPTSTNTLTNKRITARDSVSPANVGTVTWNTDNYDGGTIPVLNGAATINVSGTPTTKQVFVIEIWDNGTSHALTFGASIIFGTTVTAPTATVGSTSRPLTIELMALSDGKWHAQGVNQE